MKLIVLVGLPGSGKSTKAEEFKKQGYIVHSSDAIRNEFNLHSLDDTQRVYDILYERLMLDMIAKRNIVYDSTNLTRKRRMKLLNLLKDFKYEKICYTIITDLNTCLARNAQRTGYAKVPEDGFELMINRFNLPTSDEGWDKIIIDIQDSKMEVV